MTQKPISKSGIEQIGLRQRALRLSSRILPLIWIAVASILAYGAMRHGFSTIIMDLIVYSAIGLGMISALIALLLDDENKTLLQQNRHLLKELENLEDTTWELRESEERYRNLSEIFGDLVMHRDPQGNLTYVNDAFGELFGKQPAELLGRPLPVTFLQDRFLAGEVANMLGIREIAIETVKGPKWFLWLDTPIRDRHNQPGSHRTVARDISLQKEAEMELRRASEKAEAASKAKSRFLATVSHEMRTPLNGILGMSRLLNSSGLSKSQTAYNEAIYTSGSALLTLIEDILDTAKIEAGRFERHDEVFSLHEMVEEVCELLSSRAYSKGIGLGSFVAPDLPAMILADKGRIRQVLINLVGNAAKFTETGGIAVRALKQAPKTANHGLSKIDTSDTDNRLELVLEVTDTGPGISKSNIERVFGEFEQVETVSMRKHGGAGLGLSISRGIAHELGGRITVESKPGLGSSFRFILPVGVVKAATEGGSAAADCRSDQTPGPNSWCVEKSNLMLVVASNSGHAVEARLICEQLNARGAKAILVETAGEALDRLAGKDRIDRVILDLDKLDDPELIIRKFRRKLPPDTGLVAMLKPEMREQLDRYMDLGCDAYLIRPVRQQSLLSIIERLPKRNVSTIQSSSRNKRQANLSRSTIVQTDRKSEKKPHKTASGIRVLLAEDNEINALLAQTAIRMAGHEVSWVTNGQHALNAWHEKLNNDEPYHMILMDLHMPVMDGLTAIHQIRMEEATKQLPPIRILALTADEQDETRTQCVEAGTDGFLVKPLDPARLQEAILQNSRHNSQIMA